MDGGGEKRNTVETSIKKKKVNIALFCGLYVRVRCQACIRGDSNVLITFGDNRNFSHK